MSRFLDPAGFETALKAIGAARYHNLHRFHQRLHGGQCRESEVQAWALNRYCYQAAIPQKDAAILSRTNNQGLRRIWRQRIIDHDGDDTQIGGIARWLKLTEALGLPNDVVLSQKSALPATRFAVGAYVTFCRERPILEAVASSLTELFSPQIIGERIEGMLAHYDFIDREKLAYFIARPPQAKRDADHALAFVIEHARTPEDQQSVMDALTFKCDVLWAQLDALWSAYVEGEIPPGAWRPA